MNTIKDKLIFVIEEVNKVFPDTKEVSIKVNQNIINRFDKEVEEELSVFDNDLLLVYKHANFTSFRHINGTIINLIR